MVVPLNNQQKLTVSKLQDPSEKLRNTDVETLCSQDSVENIYKVTPRQEALKMAAETIVTHGVEIKDQLKGNALQQQDAQVSDPSNNVNTTDDIPQISGGTLAEVITKITEMLAGKTSEDLTQGADNFGSLFEVLAPHTEKLSEVIGVLAQDAVLVADINDVLGKASNQAGSKAFKDAIAKNCSDSQQKDFSNVSDASLENRREESKEGLTQQKNTGRY